MSENITFDLYQAIAEKTAIYPSRGAEAGRMYLGLKLAGEAGEVAELIGKAYRDHQGMYEKQALVKELGDVLWYVAMMATEIGVPLSEVVEVNMNKLSDRQRRGVLQGSGDDR